MASILNLPRGLSRTANKVSNRPAEYADYLRYTRTTVRSLERNLRALEAAAKQFAKDPTKIYGDIKRLELTLKLFDQALCREIASDKG